MIGRSRHTEAGVRGSVRTVRKPRAIVLLCLLAAVGASRCTTEKASKASPGVVTPGATSPIYLVPEALAEADHPKVEIAAFGATYWKPGPERLYGYALRDLRDYLGKMTDARFPLTAVDRAAQRGIFVGTFAQFPEYKPRRAESQKAMFSADPEAFAVEAQGDKLFILGKSNLGMMAAIYTALDKLRCKWFAPGREWETVPRLKELSFERLNTASDGPSYIARFFFSSYGVNWSVLREGERDGLYVLWSLRNRMGGSGYTSNSHHAPIIPGSLFQTRPELFALAKGIRSPYELARGNPEAVAMATDIAINYLKENDGKGSYYDSFSAEPNDGAPADEESLARIGNHTATDLDFWFANQIAAGLERAGLKEKRVGILSYSDHASIPSFDLHPQVSVQVTTDLDFTSKMTVEQRLDGFRERKATRLGIYEYLNLIIWSRDRPGVSPSSNPVMVAENLKRWYEHGATTYTAETSDSWISGGVGQYMASRLLWDVNRDPKRELDAYYRGAFGPAGGDIRALYEAWEKRPTLTRGNLAQWYDLISKAEKKVGGNPVYKARIVDVKRYYLYLNMLREFDINLADPRVPSKAARHNKLLAYLAANRGEDAFHAVGLFFTILSQTGQPANLEVSFDQLDEPFKALMKDNYDQAAWRHFPPISDHEIGEMFAAAALPLKGQANGRGVLDPALKLLPVGAKPPPEVRFPLLHGPGGGPPLQYILDVVAPAPKLSLDVLASNPQGGTPERRLVVTDASDNVIKDFSAPLDKMVTVDLVNVQPGTYTVTLPDQGALQLTVRGGKTFGAVRAYNDPWGFNPFIPPGAQEMRAYFVIPAGRGSLRVGLSSGSVALGVQNGEIIAPEVVGSPQLKKEPRELTFTPADRPRVGYVQWKGEVPLSAGMAIEGVTLFSPDPSYVLYETLG